LEPDFVRAFAPETFKYNNAKLAEGYKHPDPNVQKDFANAFNNLKLL